MKKLSFLFSICILFTIYSCQKELDESPPKLYADIEVESRSGLPRCKGISVLETQIDGDCCTFYYLIRYEGKRPPLFELNGERFSEFTQAGSNQVHVEIEHCNSDTLVFEILGSNSKGQKVVCKTYKLVCNICCIQTSLQVQTISNDFNENCCEFQVLAINNSRCDYSPVVNGAYHQTLFPDDLRNIRIENCANQEPAEIYLVDKGGNVCNMQNLDCGTCCDLGGKIDVWIEPREPSDKDGCCRYSVSYKNYSLCSFLVKFNGEVVNEIPPAAESGTIVEVCGSGGSLVEIVSLTAGSELACMSFELNALCDN